MSKIAVVILNWNGLPMMRAYLPSVVAYSAQEAEVWVADNASSDGSLDWLEKECPQVRTLALDTNYGFAEGYNRALRQIEAEYYVLLNSDVAVTPGWLTVLRDFMEARPDVAACQPKLLSERDHTAFEYAGACGGYMDRYGYPFCRGRVFDTVEKDHGQYDTPAEVFWTTGACMMIRSRDYWSVGGLDGRFFAHNEEIDLCWQLRSRGRKLYCLPQSVVYHVGGGTLPQGNPRKTFLNFRNNLTMLYKNLPPGELRRIMRARWWLDYLAAFQTLLLHGNVGDFKAIFRARKAFRQWREAFDEDRQRIAAASQLESIPEMAPCSLVWQYYARGKKVFTQIPLKSTTHD